MTDCVASPQAAIAKLIDFLELIDFVDFAELKNFAELAKLTEKDQTPRKVQMLGKKREFLPAGPPPFTN